MARELLSHPEHGTVVRSNLYPESVSIKIAKALSLHAKQARDEAIDECANAMCGFCREVYKVDEDFNGRGRYHKIPIGAGWEWVPCLANTIIKLKESK